jgi:hypothetical protein
MKKQIIIISLLLLTLLTVSNIFAEILQCRDPADGSINVSFMGDVVYVSYSGKSFQAFEVAVLIKETQKVEYLTFSFSSVKTEQTRSQQQRTKGGAIEKVTRCNFTSY